MESLEVDEDLMKGLEEIQAQEKQELEKKKEAFTPRENQEDNNKKSEDESWMPFLVIGTAIAVAAVTYVVKSQIKAN